MNKYKVDPTPFDTGFEATLDMFDTPTETAKNPIPMLYQSGYFFTLSMNSGYSKVQPVCEFFVIVSGHVPRERRV